MIYEEVAQISWPTDMGLQIQELRVSGSTLNLPTAGFQGFGVG